MAFAFLLILHAKSICANQNRDHLHRDPTAVNFIS